MSQIASATDITGVLSQSDLNSQDIQSIIDEFNRLEDQLNGGNLQINNQSIIVFDGSNNRVLIGYQTVLQQWGLFVSKPGVDVTTATADQLIFNSNQDIFKIVGTATLTINSFSGSASAGQVGVNVTTITATHGLSFTPAVVGYAQDVSGNYELSRTLWVIDAGLIKYVQVVEQCYADPTNVVYEIDVFASAIGSGSGISASGGPFTAKIFFLQETSS